MSQLFDFLTQDLVPEDEARKLIDPLQEECRSVWLSAWKRWVGMSEEDRARLGETAIVPPIVLYGFAQSFARELFSGREDEGLIICDTIPTVFALYVQNKVLLRFNHLGRDHVVHNTKKSKLKRDYYRQNPIAGLNNEATRLTAGCIPNSARTDAESIVISCQCDEDLFYSFRIDDGEGLVTAVPSPVTPPSPKPPVPTVAIRTARPR